MFGTSQQAAINSLGAPPATPEVPISDRSSSIGDVASSDFEQRYSTGDFGRESLIEQTLATRNQSLHDMGLLDDPSIPAAITRPQYADAIEGKPSNDIMSAVYWRDVKAQKAQEDKISEIYKNNPQLPQVSYRDAVNEAAAQANSLDMQNQDVSRHASLSSSVVGGLIGGGAATFTPENQLQAATMLLPVPGSTAATRMGGMALQQFGVSLATQAAVVNPSRQATGLTTMSGKEELEQALINGVTGGLTQGAFEAGHAGFKYFFPPTTPTAAVPVAQKLDALAEVQNPVGKLADEIKSAAGPEQAAATMASAPLETQLDLAHAAVETPSSGETALLHAGEQELMTQTAQPEGVNWEDHVSRRDEVAQSLEDGTETPTPQGALSTVQVLSHSPEAPKLPSDLSGAKPRYSYGTKQFTTSFESDIDKALYITSQTKKSKRDLDYRQFLLDNGMDDSMIAAQGQALRDRIKAMAKDAPEGNLHITPQTLPEPVKPVQPARSPSDALKAITKPHKEDSLLEFIAKQGGMTDEGGDLQSLGVNDFHRNAAGEAIPYKRKIIHEDGIHPDEMAQRAHEAGYFDEHGEERPSINDLYDKIDREMRGDKVYPHYNDAVTEHQNMLARMDEELERAGVSRNTHSDAEIQEALERQHMEDIGHQEADSIGLREEEAEKTPEDEIIQNMLEAKPGDAAPVSDESAMTIKDAMADIDEHQGLLDNLKTCFIG